MLFIFLNFAYDLHRTSLYRFFLKLACFFLLLFVILTTVFNTKTPFLFFPSNIGNIIFVSSVLAKQYTMAPGQAVFYVESILIVVCPLAMLVRLVLRANNSATNYH